VLLDAEKHRRARELAPKAQRPVHLVRRARAPGRAPFRVQVHDPDRDGALLRRRPQDARAMHRGVSSRSAKHRQRIDEQHQRAHRAHDPGDVDDRLDVVDDRDRPQRSSSSLGGEPHEARRHFDRDHEQPGTNRRRRAGERAE
jgi:hypothetical protein